MNHREDILEAIGANRAALLQLSHDIHTHPETNFNETYSAERAAAELERFGFSIERGIADLPTAFRATYGTGSLNIGICAEYDALPGVGHACGHNIICAAAVGAALALQPLADDLGLTISVLGTPGEEGGGGKIFMLQRGAFDGLHASLMVHPAPIERDTMASLAVTTVEVEYTGVAAHAAAAPERGVSASAAMTLAQNGIAMLREHFESGDRVHGIVVDGGGAPNVVPDHTKGMWFVRSSSAERMKALEAKVADVFRGAALMTGCKVRVKNTAPPYADIVTSQPIARHWRDNAERLGRKSLPVQETDGLASTDMGNVSYAMPSIHPLISLDTGGVNIHEAEFARYATSQTGDDAVVDGATLLALTIADISQDAELRSTLERRAYRAADAPDALYLSQNWDETIDFDPTKS